MQNKIVKIYMVEEYPRIWKKIFADRNDAERYFDELFQKDDTAKKVENIGGNVLAAYTFYDQQADFEEGFMALKEIQLL